MTRLLRPSAGRRRSVRSAVTALVLVVAAALSGCGTSTTADGTPIPSVQDLYAAVRATSLEATSGHVTGFMTDEATGRTMRIDLEGRADGSNQRARLGDDERGTSTILTVKGRTYVSGTWDFWAAATEPKVADRLKNKQVVVDAARLDDTERLTMGALVQKLFVAESLGPLAGITGTVTLRRQDDHDVWVVKDRGTEMWVDRDSGHLTRITLDGAGASDLSFDRWNEARTFKAPKKSALARL